MPKFLSAALALVAGACGLLASGAASANSAVVFVHGTGDYGAGVSFQRFGNSASFDQMTTGANSSACGTHSCGLWGMFSCANTCTYNTGAAARDSYWNQGSIDSMRAGRNFLVVSYWGASQAPNVAWQMIVDQIAQYQRTMGTDSFFIVTHSDGVNPIRYAMAHSTMPTSQGNTWAGVVGSRLRGSVFIAGSQKGTPLADIVGSLLSLPVIGSISSWVLGGYASPAVYFQQQGSMWAENNNWDLGPTPDLNQGNGVYALGGAPVFNVSGTYPSYYVFGGNCGDYTEAGALWTVSGLASWSGYGGGGNTDGFIGTASSQYIGWNILQSGDQLNHDESRHNCAGTGPTISAYVNAYMGQ